MSAEDLTTTVHQLNSNHSSTTATLPQYSVPAPQVAGASKYSQLLSVIEELSKDIRPTYTGNKICAERLKRSIIHARILVRECILETDRNALQTLQMSGGVFRFECLPNGHLIAALTNGCLSLIDLKPPSVTDMLVMADCILLSVSTRYDKALTSDDHGSLHIVNLTSGSVESFEAHTLPLTGERCEVWSAAWLGEHCVVSGGEDGLLKMWDLRSGHNMLAISKAHSSGVVCLKNEDDTHFLSGSYDEHIRRFDIRSLKEAIDEKNLGGGVWAIENTTSGELLVSCMYNGWCLIDGKSLEEVQSNHDLGTHLLYGASLCHTSHIVASCTFNNYRINFDRLYTPP